MDFDNNSLYQRSHQSTLQIEDALKGINKQLRREVAERKRTEMTLEKSLSLLRATLESTAEGIIALSYKEDEDKEEIVSFNQKFVEMWQFPDSALTSWDCHQCLDFCRSQLKDPEALPRLIQKLWSRMDAEVYGELELKDGKVFECYAKPHWLGEQVVITSWSLRDITQRKRTEEALRQSEVRFRTLADTTHAIIVIKQGRQICYISPAAKAITGYEKEALLEHPSFHQLLKIEEKGQVRKQNGAALHQYQEIKFLTKSGEERWLDCSAGVTEFEGEPATLITAIDITKRKQAEVEVRQDLKQERELSELRARFTSMVSHEFRTPLNVVSLSTSLLRRYSHQWTEEKKFQYFDRIQIAVEQISKLLSEVLLVSKAEAGKLKFEPKRFNLVQFCSELVAEVQLGDNNQHHITFVSRVSCPIGYVDEKLLQPILTNLLSNAIKYSPLNSQVTLKLSRQDSNLVFQVKDEGIGIPAADQQQLFELFHRGKNVGDIPGTGLGLAVVKKFVDLHGGQIDVTSKVGTGTTFTVTLPSGNSVH